MSCAARTGGVFRVFPLAAAPGRLHFHAGDVGPWGIIRSLPRMVAGKTLRAEGLVENQNGKFHFH